MSINVKPKTRNVEIEKIDELRLALHASLEAEFELRHETHPGGFSSEVDPLVRMADANETIRNHIADFLETSDGHLIADLVPKTPLSPRSAAAWSQFDIWQLCLRFQRIGDIILRTRENEVSQ